MLRHPTGLFSLLEITDRPAAMIDIINRPRFQRNHPDPSQNVQVAVIDTAIMCGLGIHFGGSIDVIGMRPVNMDMGTVFKPSSEMQSAPSLADPYIWVVERRIPPRAIQGIMTLSQFLAGCRQEGIIDGLYSVNRYALLQRH